MIKFLGYNPFFRQLRTDKGFRVEIDVSQDEYNNIKNIPNLPEGLFEVEIKSSKITPQFERKKQKSNNIPNQSLKPRVGQINANKTTSGNRYKNFYRLLGIIAKKEDREVEDLEYEIKVTSRIEGVEHKTEWTDEELKQIENNLEIWAELKPPD